MMNTILQGPFFFFFFFIDPDNIEVLSCQLYYELQK